jgi:hypothetical protein
VLRSVAVAVALALALAACGGGGGSKSSSALPLGKKAVVQHTEILGANENGPATKLGITVLRVRKGTQQELAKGGFTLGKEERSRTAYYVDVRYDNEGTKAIKRSLDVALEDQDGNLITATTIISLGGPPFAKCPKIDEGKLAPGESYESCTLFLVPKGKTPSKVSFLPYSPGKETEFVYWDVGSA